MGFLGRLGSCGDTTFCFLMKNWDCAVTVVTGGGAEKEKKRTLDLGQPVTYIPFPRESVQRYHIP